MNLNEDDLNIKNMYNYQLNELDDEEYNIYLKYLNIYYSKDHKKEKYTKDYIDSKFILIDKKNPSKKISITPSVFIDINKLYIDLKTNSNELLIKISNIIDSKNNITEENRNNFENLKKKYISFENKIKNIDDIYENHYKELELLLNKKIENLDNLVKYYKKRNHEYSQINEKIQENLKKKLINIFKENNKKIPTINEINKIAKENLVASNEIEKWFNWIEAVYFYMLVKNELVELNNKIDEKEKSFDINTHYMIIKKPVIEEY
jgi:hypothetical protein